MSNTRIGIIAVAGAGMVGALLGAPLISGATTPDTTADTGVTTPTTSDTSPGDTTNDGTAPAPTARNDSTAPSDVTADDGDRCHDRDRRGRDHGGRDRGPGGRRPGDGAPGGRRPGHHRGDRPGRIIDRGELAELLGVTPDELRTALAEGDSIADIATEQGIEVDVVIDSLVEDAQARIAQRRESINERLDERAGSVEERITDLVTGD